MGSVPKLTHWAPSIDVVASIVSSGFMRRHNTRGVVNTIFPDEALFKGREPQPFGMVSFTDVPVERAWRHRLRFGQYGIVVSRKFIERNDLRRVQYVGNRVAGVDQLRQHFGGALADAKRLLQLTYPDDAMRKEGFYNKAAAGAVLGSLPWAYALEQFEYMEDVRHKWQSEWRIVQDVPFYNDDWSISNLKDIDEKWKFISVRICSPDDVECFVCPRSECDDLEGALPAQFRGHPIFTYTPYNQKIGQSTLRTKWCYKMPNGVSSAH